MDTPQIRAFTKDGVVILRGFIAPEQLEQWREEWWDWINASPTNPASWPGKPRAGLLDQGGGFRPSTKLVNLPQVSYAACTCICWPSACLVMDYIRRGGAGAGACGTARRWALCNGPSI
jgi:hypothetical protein